MKKIRIGKDITIHWTILTNGEEISLENRDLKLVLADPLRRTTTLDYSVQGNVLTAIYRGVLQRTLGEYSLTLWENYNKDGQTAVDACNLFVLVATTCAEGGTDTEGLGTETVELTGNIEFGQGSGAGFPDAPADGKTYGRKDNDWVPIEGVSGDFVTNDELTQALQGYATKDEIPNVEGFITNTVDNLVNYYKKTETYTQSEVNNLLGQITTINFKVVELLPETGESNLIYLVKRVAKATTDDLYDEYIWIAEDSKYEIIGSTSVDLSNYYNKSEADSKFALKVDVADMLTKTEAAQTYATKTELGTKLDASVYNSEKNTFATKAEIGDINAILDNINGEVI